ncbi:MAG: VWA domain-containing protein [Oceanospirillaceae bacterium]|nr:VWA domain-containing protein [Oceanospirillaceae bacterium]
MLDDFHFLRPLWLLGWLVIPIICLLLWRIKNSVQQWHGIIDSELLNHLMQGQVQRLSKLPLIGLAICWLCAFVAMAGPSWQKLPQPQFANQQPLVLLVDLSPSMAVADIKPSRLVKMRFKLIDFLQARKQGLTALVVYSGDAHVLAPLSEDSATLISLIPTLSPNVMPVQGSNTEEGLALAVSLLKNQGYKDANIILFTDGITPTAGINVNALLQESNYKLSILGVGTVEGAPIPVAGQGFAKDGQGNIVLAKLNSELLKTIAQSNGGIYTPMSLGNSDIDKLLALDDRVSKTYQKLAEKQAFGDQWEDAGQWLLLLLIPIALLSFRRGLILQLAMVSVLISAMFSAQPAMAYQWQDLWKTNNQQGAELLQQQKYTEAAAKFEDHPWRGVAQFEAGNYQNAASSFSQQNNADGYYNQGNALARDDALEEALVAYDKALSLDTNMKDATYNRDLVAKLLEKKQAEEQQSKEEKNKQGKDKDSKSDQAKEADSKGEKPDQEKGAGSEDSSQGEGDSTADDQQHTPNAEQQKESSSDQPTSQQSEDTEQQALEKLKQEQQKKQQQAVTQFAEQQQDQQEENDQVDAQQAIKTPEQKSEKTPSEQQLENWLGQLPEDASRLVRNKFNYEYQKKRQAYLNGQWQPPKEQRW